MLLTAPGSAGDPIGGQECGEKGSSFHAPLFLTFPSRFLIVWVFLFVCLFLMGGRGRNWK